MALCKIDGGILAPADCQDLIVTPGVGDRLILINKEDILSATFDGTNPMLITAMTLKAGGNQGYEFQGQLNSNEPSTEMIKQGFNRVWNHQVIFKGFSTTPDTKLLMANLAKSKVVAVVENNDKTFEVYGFDTGLLVETMTREPGNTETGGAWDITLASDENIKEPKPPLSWLDTDYATTLTAVDGLLTPTA